MRGLAWGRFWRWWRARCAAWRSLYLDGGEIKGAGSPTVVKVEDGAKLVNKAGQTMEGGGDELPEAVALVTEIAEASQEQSGGIEQQVIQAGWARWTRSHPAERSPGRRRPPRSREPAGAIPVPCPVRILFRLDARCPDIAGSSLFGSAEVNAKGPGSPFPPPPRQKIAPPAEDQAAASVEPGRGRVGRVPERSALNKKI